jgi:hypothetical protein
MAFEIPREGSFSLTCQITYSTKISIKTTRRRTRHREGVKEEGERI